MWAQPNPRPKVRAALRSEALADADVDGMRHDLENERRVRAAVNQPRRPGTERVAGDDVGLPMRLLLHAAYGIVERQQFQRIDRRVLMRIFEHERGDDRAHCGHLAAGEALVAMALEPEIRVTGRRPAIARAHP